MYPRRSIHSANKRKQSNMAKEFLNEECDPIADGKGNQRRPKKM